MKKIILVLILWILTLSSCTKEEIPELAPKKDFYLDIKKAGELDNIAYLKKTWKIDSTQNIVLNSNANGRVKAINVKSGDNVSEWQVLAVLEDNLANYNLNLEVASNNLNATKNNLDMAKNNLEKAKLNYDSTKLKLDKSISDIERNLNNLDVQSGRNVCLIGSNVATRLFGERPERSLDKIIKVGSTPYRVVGLLKSKGSSSMLRQDDVIVTSYTNVRRYANIGPTYLIGINVTDINVIPVATDEATSVFRAIRKLQPTEEVNFVIEKSDKFAEMFIGFLSSITGAASAIGLITLIGAAIGLMNIMLVAVNERTKEVGLIKAIGGKSKYVRQQFLFESMIISLLGAIFGIILGILVGNVFGIILDTGFVVPWTWVFIGIVICSVVGLAAGIYPAMKAAKLNPIVALRYE